MPLPPTVDSIRYADDLIQWEWGKTQRDTPRGKQASREELWTPDIMRIVMAEALSIDTISDTTTPALARLLASTLMGYLHNDATFLDLLKKARAEYQSKATAIAPVHARPKNQADGTYSLSGYRLPGKPNGKTLYISNGSKYLSTGNARP